MSVGAYFDSLNPAALLKALPGTLAQGLIWAIMALGVYLTFRMLDVADLTMDGSLATGGAVCVMLLRAGWNPVLALLVSFVAGMIAGLATGLLHTGLGIPAILAGILTQISLYSINLHILSKPNQAINPRTVSLVFTSAANRLWETIAIALVLVAALMIVIYWYLNTENGSALRATGINSKMARAQGVNTNTMTVIGLALSNGLVALSGAVLSQYQAFADINMGRGAIVIGLAAVIIGEVIGEAIFRKRITLWMHLVFVAIGSIIYYLVYAFVIWLKFPPDDMKILTAIVVAVFLAIPYLKSAGKSSFRGLAKRNAKKETADNA